MKLRIAVSLVAVVMVVLHKIYPDITIDSTTLVFLIIAVLPWLAPIIKSLEIPGGFKIELQDIKAATEKVVTASAREVVNTSVGHIEEVRADDAINRLREVAANDPNLALVGVDIELEKQLLDIAERQGLSRQQRSLGQLLKNLERGQAIPPQVASGLRDLIALRNRAAHGADVSPDAAEWVLNIFPSILQGLKTFSRRKASN